MNNIPYMEENNSYCFESILIQMQFIYSWCDFVMLFVGMLWRFFMSVYKSVMGNTISLEESRIDDF
jgi:hypothetical protein